MYKYLFTPLTVAFFLLPAFSFASIPYDGCPNLYRNLSFGSRGQDVVELQAFLIAQGDLAFGLNTGYFGRLTESAVKSWQVRNGVVSSGTPSTTGYGAVGPRTRAKIARVCGGEGNVSTGFSVTPASGTAPLNVTASIGSSWGCPPAYTLEWGDGTKDVQEGNPPGTGCTAVMSTFHKIHTYASPGTYTVRFTKQLPTTCSQLESYPSRTICDPPQYNISTMTITVTGTSVAPNDKQSCEKIGGKWGNVGDAPYATLYCNMPTIDAGKACTDSSQCQSFCQATTYAEPGTPVGGACYGWKEGSCTGGIANGKAVPVACY